MKVVIASSEAVPFSKTGGLADVASALSKALAQSGHDVTLIVPYYSSLQTGAKGSPEIVPTGTSVDADVGPKRSTANVLRSQLSGSNVTVLLIDCPEYFGRNGLYQEDGVDYDDNCARFVFFSRAVMESIRVLKLSPDVIHANDWQTGLIPVLLDAEYRNRDDLAETASVFTIHNMAFQGQFWHWDMLLTGLDWDYFNWQQMEFFNHLNLLKSGVVFAEMVTTVSPTYAKEIQTEEFGFGLHDVLSAKADSLVGVLNGVDTEIWNPEKDPALVENYSADSVFAGKAACKTNLQKTVGLPVRDDAPLFGIISRMTDQKGFDLLEHSVGDILNSEAQLCVLGSGEAHWEHFFENLAQMHPQQVAATIGFDDKLAHQIEAGADIFLMPSRFEPCGLNQMYSLLYGTVPIVRSVGGLADSVVNATEDNLANGTATGFQFSDYTHLALSEQIHRALEIYRDAPKWQQIMSTGMRQDWSWSRSAQTYARVYERAIKNVRLATCQ